MSISRHDFEALLMAMLVACVAPFGEAAQEGAGPVSPVVADLGTLLREAEANNPALQAAAARLEAARRVPSQAGTPPDPELGLSYTNVGLSRFTFGDDNDAVLSLGWTQEVPYPGKLDGAAQVAVAETERRSKQLELLRLEIGAAVKSGYADLYRLDRTAALLEETRATLQIVADTARRRYEVGEGIQESVLKAQTQILRLEAELTRVAQERRSAELGLNAAVGRSADTPIGRVQRLPEADILQSAEALAEEAMAVAPAIGELEAAVRRAEASARLARLNLKPDFAWTASYGERGDIDPMVMGGFGIRLPVRRDRKQVQALLQAEAELAAARHDLDDGRVRVRAAARDLFSKVERAERLIVLFAEGVIPHARSTIESAHASYSVGRIGFLDLLVDLTTLLNAQVDHLSHEAERFQSLAALEPILARELIRAREGTGSSAAEEKAPVSADEGEGEGSDGADL